jgi:hypothetical protein
MNEDFAVTPGKYRKQEESEKEEEQLREKIEASLYGYYKDQYKGWITYDEAINYYQHALVYASPEAKASHHPRAGNH